MDPGDSSSSSSHLKKRQRAPLSDSEDNVFSSSGNDGQKRLRLDRPGHENRSPTPSCSRPAEQAVKPDTPAIKSVRLLVQQLTQRPGGGPVLAQRCLSDPGAVILHNKGFPGHLLGEDEFHQRLERFKAPPVFQASPSLVPPGSCPRSCSDFVSGIQQKLQGSLTPSSKQAALIRQEREKELRLLHAQPISENAWLKRSSSDPSLSEQGDGNANPADGSFTETLASKSEKQKVKTTGDKAPCDPLPAANLVELESLSEHEERNMCREPESPKVQRSDTEQEQGGSVREDEDLGSHGPHWSTSKLFIDEEPSVLASPPGEEVSGQTPECLEVVEDGASELPSLEVKEEERRGGSSDGEEEMEPSTDEELRLWKYPRAGGDGQREAPVEDPEERGEEPEGESSAGELSSHDETNTAEMIDQMFEEVLEYADRMEEEDRRGDEDMDDRDKDKMHPESEKERREEDDVLLKEDNEEEEKEEKEEKEEDESKEVDASEEDELLTFPPSGILSPLSKSVEAVVTPLRLAVHQVSMTPSLLLTPEEEATTAPLYSIDAYRTQRQSKLPAIQSVTPATQRRAPEESRPPPSVNTKERIAALNEEAGRLQTVISQTLQALSCCTDHSHGRGSLEEAEAEKLLLVSCEKRAALLAEVIRLREERGSVSEDPDGDYISQQPCRGTVNIANVQLPLKVEFVCSSRNRTGRPSHYFFILIRYGPCNIVATPLATAADAKSGDTVSFPTSVTLKDIRSNFEIDVEVYSLSHASGSTCTMERISAKPRVTPRKLLSTITRSNNSLTAAALPALNPRRSSNFCLVGSHKITLASLGQTRFPLDKMKFDGKIRRLLGDEFQEKVPFLSPLEGNVYLRLDSQGLSNVQHQGFLTMFEVVNGFGAWHRRFFNLEGSHLYYWNHPNDREAKAAEGTISLASSPSPCVKPVKRDSCARPFTFELVSNVHTQLSDDSQDAIAKCWFSSDTKQERCDWMDKLNQALLDLHTWNPSPQPAHSLPSEAPSSSSSSSSGAATTSSSSILRESLL